MKIWKIKHRVTQIKQKPKTLNFKARIDEKAPEKSCATNLEVF